VGQVFLWFGVFYFINVLQGVVSRELNVVISKQNYGFNQNPVGFS